MPPPTDVVTQNGGAQVPTNPTEATPTMTPPQTEKEVNYARAPSTNPTPRFNQRDNPASTHNMTTRSQVRERNRNPNDFVTYSSYFDALH